MFNQNKYYDFIFYTKIPAFYKVDLFDLLSTKFSILVIYIGLPISENRSDSFLSDNTNFDSINISHLSFYKKILFLCRLSSHCSSSISILNGWDRFEFWLIRFISKSKPVLFLESSIIESSTNPLMYFLKFFFLLRISSALVPDISHHALLSHLRFNGNIFYTHGVGVVKPLNSSIKNLSNVPPIKLLFLGRLVEEKNLLAIINAVKNDSRFTLDIYGTGPLFSHLSQNKHSSITFHGSIERNLIYKLFPNYHCLLLLSTSETWGVVVEEALSSGCSVAINKNIGIYNFTKSQKNVYIDKFPSFPLSDLDDLFNFCTSFSIQNRRQFTLEFANYLNSRNDNFLLIFRKLLDSFSL